MIEGKHCFQVAVTKLRQMKAFGADSALT